MRSCTAGKDTEGKNKSGGEAKYTDTAESGGIPAEITGIKVVEAGAGYSLIVASDGTLWAADFNNIKVVTGESGDTNLLKYAVEHQVTHNVQNVVLGLKHVLVLKTDGTLWGFGDNNLGQLGDGKRFFVPRQVFPEN